MSALQLPFKVLDCSVLSESAPPKGLIKGTSGWKTDIPYQKAILKLGLDSRCFVSEVRLVNDGSSHVELRGAEDTDTKFPFSRRVVARQELLTLYEHKLGVNKNGSRKLDADTSLSYKTLYLAVYNMWEPPARIGLKTFSVYGYFDDDPMPHPPYTPPIVLGPRTVNPHEVIADPRSAMTAAATTTTTTSSSSSSSSSSSPPPPTTTAATKRPASTSSHPPPPPPPPPSSSPSPAPTTKGPTTTTTTSSSSSSSSPPSTAPVPRPSTPTTTQVHKKAKASEDKPLRGVKICLSGFVNPERGQIRDAATALGAEFVDDWSKGGTHLVCAYRNTPKYVEVKSSGKGWIVTKEWVFESKRNSRRMDERMFQLSHSGGGAKKPKPAPPSAPPAGSGSGPPPPSAGGGVPAHGWGTSF